MSHVLTLYNLMKDLQKVIVFIPANKFEMTGVVYIDQTFLHRKSSMKVRALIRIYMLKELRVTSINKL